MSKKTSICSSYKANTDSQNWIITRRVFLKSSLASLVGLSALPLSCALNSTSSVKLCRVLFGIVTDCHYADADTLGTRFYRESLDKLNECVSLMNSERVDFLIELGDIKDQNSPPVEQRTLSYLQAIEKVFQRFDGLTYHVLGNHDVDRISKKQFLTHVENTNIKSGSYYSFNLNSLSCVVLDANYRADGTDYDHGNFDWIDANIPPEELDWLREDLAEVPGPVIVFIHQLLDGTGSVYVNNADDVRQILQSSGKVLAVFQGHHHSGSYSNTVILREFTTIL